MGDLSAVHLNGPQRRGGERRPGRLTREHAARPLLTSLRGRKMRTFSAGPVLGRRGQAGTGRDRQGPANGGISEGRPLD